MRTFYEVNKTNCGVWSDASGITLPAAKAVLVGATYDAKYGMQIGACHKDNLTAGADAVKKCWSIVGARETAATPTNSYFAIINRIILTTDTPASSEYTCGDDTGVTKCKI